MRGGFVSWPRNCTAAKSLGKNLARLRVMRAYSIAWLEDLCAAGMMILQNAEHFKFIKFKQFYAHA